VPFGVGICEMKKYIHIFLLVLTFLILFAGVKLEERYVKDNVFHSIYPKLTVNVDPKYTYLGRFDYTLEMESRDGVQGSTVETETYVFVDAVDKQVKGAVYIQIRRQQTKYIRNLVGDKKANLKTGTCSVGGEEYQCYTRAISVSSDEPIARLIKEKGYLLPDCMLTRAYVRADKDIGSYLIMISYNEDLSPSGFDCKAWQDQTLSTLEQENYLARFEQQSGTSFQIKRKKKYLNLKIHPDEDKPREKPPDDKTIPDTVVEGTVTYPLPSK
jgi:hypothetical protein